MIKPTQVDAALDSVSDDDDPSKALGDLLDASGDWDWSDGAEHSPEDRLAVVESSGAYWLVYRGSESDEATRFSISDEAHAALKDQAESITGVAS